MATEYTVHNPPPGGYVDTFYNDNRSRHCEAVINPVPGWVDASTRWRQCRADPFGNGFCNAHQYFVKDGMEHMRKFFMVVSEHSDRATRKYATLEEAELVAEELTRRTGQDVYILKPFCKASTHRVKWEDIEEA
jgi:hypothetical protein